MLYNGVELHDYRTATPFRAEAPTIFFCGRHEERKGLDVLLAAMAQLGPEVRLWVASNGPDTERLREQTKADTRIEWLGRLSDEEKIARLKGADVFCAPSLHGESFGVVLIEAMAAGTCVVASALDGYRNVATDGVDSLLVPPGDADALAAAIGYQAVRMSIRASEAESDMNIEVVRQELLEFLKAVESNPHGST